MEIIVIKRSINYIDDCEDALVNSELGKRYFSENGSARKSLEEGFNENDIYVSIDNNSNCKGFVWVILNGIFHSSPYIHILLEPMAYYTFQGVMIAITATEAAMYDEQLSGLLRNKMVSLSHKNLPLAMFLEVGNLGYTAWSGSTTKAASNADIKSFLGLGIVRFTEQPEPPIVSAYDYEYSVNTEVITSVMISGGQSDPDRLTRVSFIIDGRTYNVGNVYYPSGDYYANAEV